jgi:hypothetical protein
LQAPDEQNRRPVEPALLQSIDPVWLLYCEGANVMKNILRNDEPPQDLALTEGQEISGEWLVEYSDDDGGDYLTIFEGEEAEARARDYRDALKEGRLGTRIADAKVGRSEQRGRVIRFPR